MTANSTAQDMPDIDINDTEAILQLWAEDHDHASRQRNRDILRFTAGTFLLLLSAGALFMH